MQLVCGKCQRSLSELAEGVRYCPYCGSRISTIPDGHEAPTGTYEFDDLSSAGTDSGLMPIGNGRTRGQMPDEIGPFKLLKVLGSGAMGTVFEAIHKETQQPAAVKLLDPRLVDNAVSVERFRQEGRLASQINHPHSVFVFIADADAGWPYIAMELMPGNTLKTLIDEEGPLEPLRAVRLAIEIVDGLNEAHRNGVIHRDVKPSNCFLTADGHVKVGDFGLSKAVGSSSNAREKGLTRTGTFVGTVWFAAPEQIKGETIGFDTDVYSVTATLFYLLTGQAPHQSDSLTSSMAKTLSESPASARILNPNVSKSLERVLMTGLERDRERRYGTLDELREDLEALLPERQLPARPRLRIAAYCIDLLLVALVALPIDILLELSGFKPLFRVGVFNTSWTMLIIMFSYFTVGEGWYGTTLGKILIGLRVIRHRQVEPPGIPRALARMSLFLALVFLTVNFGWLTRQLMNWTGIMIPGLPIVTALIAAVAGGIGLSIMFRKKWGFRALYDMATDCAVIIRMRLQCELRFAAHAGNWLDDLAKTLPKSSDLPSIPGVEVLARIEQPPGHPHLFLAKDITLSRRLLIELEEISADTELMVDTGPTRLRNTGRGELQWQNQRMRWLAFNAPLGAAFIDVVDPAKPLQWPQIYPLLVQLVEEIDRGRKDDSLPEHLNLAQLWLEPNGRLRIIDFVLPNKRNLQIADAENEVKLLREFITLAFEGQPRCCQQPPEAPLPLAARQVIEQIFADDIYPERLAHDLNDLRTMPRNTSTTLRAAHIGVQSLLMSMGFGLLLLIPTFFQFQQTYIAHQEYRTLQDSNNALTAMMQLPPEKAPAWVKKMPPQEIQVVMGYLEHEVDESEKLLEQQHSYMNQFERTVFEQVISELASEERPLPPISPNHLGGITESRVQDRLEAARSSNGKSLMLLQTGWALFFWPLCALVFNGGIGMWIAGVAVVNRHGLRANRMIVLVRSMLTWLPFYLVCILAMWIIVKHPELHDLRLFLLMLAPATLVAYLFLALRRPERSPVDQLFKTYIVPR